MNKINNLYLTVLLDFTLNYEIYLNELIMKNNKFNLTENFNTLL